ncbi:MAG TPA: response regulator [Flavobacterium sp.]|jgi:CheY-like chemotaxis protein
MSKTGAIVIVEDDHEDKKIYQDLLDDIGMPNKIEWFEKADDAFHYLKNSQSAFIILSEAQLKGKSGLELKREIDDDPELRKKSIPFIFFSSAAKKEDVDDAFTMLTVQGFFKKGNNFSDMRDMLKMIFDYWMKCKHPNAD